ncbi:MAG: hypothetical protein V3V33_00710 [Candidatus Lokiarchaeia archaeon]
MNERNHEQDDLKKDFDDLYQYVKNVTGIYRNLSSTFMVVSLTAFIFLISVGYPDLLDVQIIILYTAVKVISLSLALLVFSFFLFLISTFIYLYRSLKVNTLYLYWGSKLSLADRYEKIDKLTESDSAGLFLFLGIMTLISAVIFMFLYFSAIGIVLIIIILLFYGFLMFIFYLPKILKRICRRFKRFNKK